MHITSLLGAFFLASWSSSGASWEHPGPPFFFMLPKDDDDDVIELPVRASSRRGPEKPRELQRGTETHREAQSGLCMYVSHACLSMNLSLVKLANGS